MFASWALIYYCPPSFSFSIFGVKKKKNADISNYPGEPSPGSASLLPVNCPSLITSGSFQLRVSTS